MLRYDENNSINRFQKVDDIINARYYSDKVEIDQWEKTTATSAKNKVLLVAAAIALVIGTVLNYMYLGGIEGIMTGQRLLEEGMTSYICAVGSLIAMPVLAVFLLWLAFKKKK